MPCVWRGCEDAAWRAPCCSAEAPGGGLASPNYSCRTLPRRGGLTVTRGFEANADQRDQTRAPRNQDPREAEAGAAIRVREAEHPLSDLVTPVGFRNSAIGSDLDFYAARWYSLTRPPRTGRRWIRFRVRSATG
jgi:hypothetical protein